MFTRLTTILLLASWIAAQEARKSNILFLFADDQRKDTIGAHGNELIETPNIDRLVRRGFSFRNNYCMGSRHGAVCAPSRAMLMSGRTLHRVRDDLRGVQTMPQTLRAAGYETFATGKWHNRQDALLRSFRYGRAVMLGGMSDHNKVPIVDIDDTGTKVVDRRVGARHSSEVFADAAIEFLHAHAQRKSAKPFLCYVSFTAPHDPRDPPPAYRDRYYEKNLPLPPNFRPQHGWDLGDGTMRVRDEALAAWPRTESVVRDQLAEYYGLITHLDDQVGRILAALDATDQTDNTIVVYTADHGLAVGSHGLLGKQSVYEHSMGCPLILAGPGIPAGESSHALTYLLDLYPTLCDAVGVAAPPAVEGKSLLGIVRGRDSGVRGSLFTLYRNAQFAVRDARWKAIRLPLIDKTMLFDLQNDPHEVHDLSAVPAHGERVDAMLDLLRTWKERCADRSPLDVDDPTPAQVDLSGKPRKPDRWQPKWIRDKYFRSGDRAP